MGQPKQLLPLRGRPLLQHVIDEAAASCLAEIILVLGYRAEEISRAIRMPDTSAHVTINSDYARGQSTSLRLGLRSASPKAKAVAILLGDQPQVSASLIDRVATDFLRADVPIVRPLYVSPDGRAVPGHPVFLARRIWAEIEKLAGDQGVRGLIALHPDWLLEIPIQGPPPADIDTRADYVREAGNNVAH